MKAVWVNDEEQLRSQKLIKNIRIHGPGRIKYNTDSIDIIIDDQEGGGVSSSYESPFLVTKVSDTSVKVLGNTTNGYKNYIGLGNSWVELTEQTVSSISSTGWLYIEITYSTSYTLTAKFSAGEVPPTRDNTHGIILVRRIVCADSKISSINLPVQIVDMGGKVF